MKIAINEDSCCDQPQTRTQGYYSRGNWFVTNVAPRRREYVPR